jgi:hypothetical protein
MADNPPDNFSMIESGVRLAPDKLGPLALDLLAEACKAGTPARRRRARLADLLPF